MQVAGWTDCLVMLQQNQVDAVSTDDTILAGLARAGPVHQGASATRSPRSRTAWRCPRSSRDFVRFVNAVLEQMRTDGSWTTIYNKWLLELLDTAAPAPPAARYRD